MNKWEKLNNELADARHYAADMKERVQELERENAELRAKLNATPVAAILREWDGHGSADDTAAIEVWIQQLWQSQQAITVLCGEVQP